LKVIKDSQNQTGFGRTGIESGFQRPDSTIPFMANIQQRGDKVREFIQKKQENVREFLDPELKRIRLEKEKGEDFNRKVEVLINRDVETIDKEVKDFEKKYSGKELGEKEFKQAQKEQAVLERKIGITNQDIQNLEKKFGADEKFIGELRNKHGKSIKTFVSAVGSGFVNVVPSVVDLGIGAVTRPSQTFEETVEGVLSLPSQVKSNPAQTLGEFAGSIGFFKVAGEASRIAKSKSELKNFKINKAPKQVREKLKNQKQLLDKLQRSIDEDVKLKELKTDLKLRLEERFADEIIKRIDKVEKDIPIGQDSLFVVQGKTIRGFSRAEIQQLRDYFIQKKNLFRRQREQSKGILSLTAPKPKQDRFGEFRKSLSTSLKKPIRKGKNFIDELKREIVEGKKLKQEQDFLNKPTIQLGKKQSNLEILNKIGQRGELRNRLLFEKEKFDVASKLLKAKLNKETIREQALNTDLGNLFFLDKIQGRTPRILNFGLEKKPSVSIIENTPKKVFLDLSKSNIPKVARADTKPTLSILKDKTTSKPKDTTPQAKEITSGGSVLLMQELSKPIIPTIQLQQQSKSIQQQRQVLDQPLLRQSQVQLQKTSFKTRPKQQPVLLSKKSRNVFGLASKSSSSFLQQSKTAQAQSLALQLKSANLSKSATLKATKLKPAFAQAFQNKLKSPLLSKSLFSPKLSKPVLFPRLKTKKIPEQQTGSFLVQVRRFGVFRTIARPGTLSQAFQSGKQRVKTTLARTFRLIPNDKGKGITDKGFSNLGIQFRKPKKGSVLDDPFTFIEKSKFALSEKGEQSEIRNARLKKQLNRGLITSI